MKSLIFSAGTFVVVALAGFAGNACSSSLDGTAQRDNRVQAHERVGTVGLELQPVFGITVSSVHYVVTAGNPTSVPTPAIVADGNLPTPGTGATFSAGFPLPVGSGYYLSLSGVSAELGDDITCSGAFGPFAVTANNSAQLNLTLTCSDHTKGQVLAGVDVATDACPHLIVDYAVAEPSVAGVGFAASVHASAYDLDSPSESITYAWSVVDPARAGVGHFTPANARNTAFLCTSSGDTVRLRVTATNHQCSKSLETVVSCANFDGCGNGRVDPSQGETCDSAADPLCPADCTQVCGDGMVEGSETCDPLPLNSTLCYAPGSARECTLIPNECGDGRVSPPDACDTLGNLGPNGLPLPPGSVCSADCTQVIQRCGNGVVDAGEVCDPTGPPESIPQNCTSSCELRFFEPCMQCEQSGNCFASVDNCRGPTGTPFTPQQTKLCYDVTTCIQESNCLDGTGSLGKCYCGTLGAAACGVAPYDLNQAGAPNGPCAAVMQQGNPGLTTNAAVLGGLTGRGRPTGAAGQRLNCQKQDPICAPLCGF